MPESMQQTLEKSKGILCKGTVQMFKNRKSPRRKNWDYTTPGAYFITTCTKERKHYFGEIHNGKMELSPIGVIADLLMYEIKSHNKNIRLVEYIIMPDHIHALLVLEPPEMKTDTDILADGTNQSKKAPYLPNVVGGYKSAVTKHAHRLGFDFAWQTRYHDTYVRDEFSLERVRNYIKNNPKNWKKSKSIPSQRKPESIWAILGEKLRHDSSLYERKSA
jgi:putative transposase